MQHTFVKVGLSLHIKSQGLELQIPSPWGTLSSQGLPSKLTWVGLLFLSDLFQSTQQGIDVGLDLCQLCFDGL